MPTKHYLIIHGPMHTNASINSTVRLKCRVQLLIQNNTTELKMNYSKTIEESMLNKRNWSEISSSSPSSSTGLGWHIINPHLLPNKLKIIVQWMKDGFGYDQDALEQTFNGRYTLIESKEKDIYDLMIRNIQFEDEGEYACQARLIEMTNPYHRLHYHHHHQFVNYTKVYDRSIKVDQINNLDTSIHQDSLDLPMSLIKSNTAYLNVI
ncbi:irregular chiasm C roughest, partial [Schistosoma japonicum]